MAITLNQNLFNISSNIYNNFVPIFYSKSGIYKLDNNVFYEILKNNYYELCDEFKIKNNSQFNINYKDLKYDNTLKCYFGEYHAIFPEENLIRIFGFFDNYPRDGWHLF